MIRNAVHILKLGCGRNKDYEVNSISVFLWKRGKTHLKTQMQNSLFSTFPIVSFLFELIILSSNPMFQKCPFEAINIINLPSNLGKETTHRYSANSFKLHRYVCEVCIKHLLDKAHEKIYFFQQ